MDSNGRYQFTNWTEQSFEGRFGGVPYIFAPSETKEYDPDKHYMLIILSKQLADRELAKGVKGVLRTKEAGNDYGKAIDANGNLYKPSIEMRKELMRKAIGVLVDKPIPYPEIQGDATEAGSTQGGEALKAEVAELKELVQSLVAKLGEKSEPPTIPPAPPATPAGNGYTEPKTEEVSNVGVTRDVLVEMLRDKGVPVPEGASKDQLIGLLGGISSIGATP